MYWEYRSLLKLSDHLLRHLLSLSLLKLILINIGIHLLLLACHMNLYKVDRNSTIKYSYSTLVPSNLPANESDIYHSMESQIHQIMKMNWYYEYICISERLKVIEMVKD